LIYIRMHFYNLDRKILTVILNCYAGKPSTANPFLEGGLL